MESMVTGARNVDHFKLVTTSVLSPQYGEDIESLVADALASDRFAPLSEQARIELRRSEASSGIEHILVVADAEKTRFDIVGYCQLHKAAEDGWGSAEIVVRPGFRNRGIGYRLAVAALRASDENLRVWAHGNLDSASRLAEKLGLGILRKLHKMHRSLNDSGNPLPEIAEIPDLSVRTFDPTIDRLAWLALNSEAFADHPEQGSWSVEDLNDRIAEPWFDPEGFFLAYRGGRLVGFHWTKIEDGVGEVYVVGIHPSEQRIGLGRYLTIRGLRYMESLGIAQSILYVDDDNSRAMRMYSSLGFAVATTDVMYGK
jgi:mycothiol synthase